MPAGFWLGFWSAFSVRTILSFFMTKKTYFYLNVLFPLGSLAGVAFYLCIKQDAPMLLQTLKDSLCSASPTGCCLFLAVVWFFRK